VYYRYLHRYFTGGLAAAISCAKSGLAVKVLEKAPEFLPLGAGIQIPPNGVRALRELGLDDDRLCSVGAVSLAALNLRRYKDGRDLLRRPGREAFTQAYGAPW
jgi:salicylate hydroxylase